MFLLLIIYSLNGFSQEVVSDKATTHFYRIDGNVFKIKRAPIESLDAIYYTVSINSEDTDTIGFADTPTALFEKWIDKIFLANDVGDSNFPRYELHKISLLSGNDELLTKSAANFSGVLGDKLYGTRTLDYKKEYDVNSDLPEGSELGVPIYTLKTKLVSFDLVTEQEAVVFDINDFLKDFYGEIFRLYFSPLANSILIVIGDTEDGAIYYDFHYFIYKADKESVSKITFSDLSKDEIKYGINYGDLYPDYATGQHLISTEGSILDENFQRIDKSLKKNRDVVRGYNYQEDSILSINLSSQLDAKGKEGYQKAIISFAPSYKLEKILYAIYHNQELSRYALEQLNRQQLQLAKNMVFARHNYQFDSPYYQAFFNLFDFYNTEAMRKSRAKTMDGKMTINDVQNSRLINQVLRNR